MTTSASSDPDDEAPDWIGSIERSLAEAVRDSGRVAFLAPRPGQDTRVVAAEPAPSVVLATPDGMIAGAVAEEPVAEALPAPAPAEAPPPIPVAEPAKAAAPAPQQIPIQGLSWRPRPRLLALLVLAFILFRLVGLDATGLGVDDGVSLINAVSPISRIVPAMLAEHEVHPPLFFYWLHPFIAVTYRQCPLFLFGIAAWFRLAVIPWLAAVAALTWMLGVELLGRRGALVATLLVIASNYLAYYGLELRMYPMLSAFVLLAVWAAARMQQGRRPYRYALLCGVAMVLAFLTQYLAMVFIAALALAVALGRGPWPARILAFVPVALAGALWWPILHHQMGAQNMLIRGTPSWPQLLDLLFQMTCGVTWRLPLAGWPELGRLPIHPLKAVVGLAVGAMAYYGAKRAPAESRRLLACMVAVPLLLDYGISDLTRFHIFEYKYFQPLAPFWFLALAGLARTALDGETPRFLVRLRDRLRLSGRAARLLSAPAALALVLLINVFAWINFHAHPIFYGPQDWRGVLARMAPRFQVGDEVVVHPSMMAAPVYVYGSLGNPFLVDLQPGVKPHLAIMGVDSASDPALRRVEKSSTRLWLLTTPYHPFVQQHHVESALLSLWYPVEVFETPNQWPANVIRVSLLHRR